MKVYLVWERVDYSDYGIKGIFDSREKAEKHLNELVLKDEWSLTYWIEEKEVE